MEVIPEWTRIDVEEAVRLACRVNVNAHGLRDDSGSNLVIGVGLFPLTAMINHSCRPNCTFVYFGKMRTWTAVSCGMLMLRIGTVLTCPPVERLLSGSSVDSIPDLPAVNSRFALFRKERYTMRYLPGLCALSHRHGEPPSTGTNQKSMTESSTHAVDDFRSSPNAELSPAVDGQLEVRTLERVSAGTELNVYYIDLLQSTTARRKELLATKHFLCKCSR